MREEGEEGHRGSGLVASVFHVIDAELLFWYPQGTAPDFAPTACIRRLRWVTGRSEGGQRKSLRRKVEGLLSDACRELLERYRQMVYPPVSIIVARSY